MMVALDRGTGISRRDVDQCALGLDGAGLDRRLIWACTKSEAAELAEQHKSAPRWLPMSIVGLAVVVVGASLIPISLEALLSAPALS